MDNDADDCVVYVDPLENVLAAAGDAAGETWLFCLYCDRFFQAKHLRRDWLGNMQGCALCECAGFNVAIHLWNAFDDQDGRWPRSVDELFHGRPSPDSEAQAASAGGCGRG